MNEAEPQLDFFRTKLPKQGRKTKKSIGPTEKRASIQNKIKPLIIAEQKEGADIKKTKQRPITLPIPATPNKDSQRRFNSDE